MKSVRRLADGIGVRCRGSRRGLRDTGFAHAADQSHDRNQSEHQSDDFRQFAQGAGHVVFVQTDNPIGQCRRGV